MSNLHWIKSLYRFDGASFPSPAFLVFALFQTMTLLMLTVFFFLVLMPIGLFHRVTFGRGQFFKSANVSTIEDNEAMRTDFERLF